MSNEKVNSKQHDKGGTRLCSTAGDLAFGDVSISLLARSVRLSTPLPVVKDTGPIRATAFVSGRGVHRLRWVGCSIKIRVENTEEQHAVRNCAFFLTVVK